MTKGIAKQWILLLIVCVFPTISHAEEAKTQLSVIQRVFNELKPAGWTKKRWEHYLRAPVARPTLRTLIMRSGTVEKGSDDFVERQRLLETENALGRAEFELLQLFVRPEGKIYDEVTSGYTIGLFALYFVNEVRLEVYPSDKTKTTRVIFMPKSTEPDSGNVMVVRVGYDADKNLPLDAVTIFDCLADLGDREESVAAFDAAKAQVELFKKSQNQGRSSIKVLPYKK